MQEAALPLIVLVALLLACLPLNALRAFVLAILGWGLRLALAAAIASLGFFMFRPDMAPAPVAQWVAQVCGEGLGIADPHWQLTAAAALLTAALLPLITLCDAGRMAVWRNETAPPQRSSEVRPVVDRRESSSPRPEPQGKSIRPSQKTMSAVGNMTGERKKRLGDLID